MAVLMSGDGLGREAADLLPVLCSDCHTCVRVCRVVQVGYVGVNKAEASRNNGSSKGGQAAKGGDVERIWVRCEALMPSRRSGVVKACPMVQYALTYSQS